MNENQLSEGSININNGPVQVQDQQIIPESDEQNIVVGMALMPSLQQNIASRVLEGTRAKEATKLWDKFFTKGLSTQQKSKGGEHTGRASGRRSVGGGPLLLAQPCFVWSNSSNSHQWAKLVWSGLGRAGDTQFTVGSEFFIFRSFLENIHK